MRGETETEGYHPKYAMPIVQLIVFPWPAFTHRSGKIVRVQLTHRFNHNVTAITDF